MACKKINGDIQWLSSLLTSHTVYKKYYNHNTCKNWGFDGTETFWVSRSSTYYLKK
jgi:hypothetical protein